MLCVSLRKSTSDIMTGDQRVANSRLNQSHCVVSLSKTLYPPISTGTTQEDRKTS